MLDVCRRAALGSTSLTHPTAVVTMSSYSYALYMNVCTLGLQVYTDYLLGGLNSVK